MKMTTRLIATILIGTAVSAATAATISTPLTDQQQALLQQHVPLGLPSSGELLFREGYVLSHNNWLKIPNWVAYKLDPRKLKRLGRSEDFRPDLELKLWQRSELSDYRRSGYDRGHLAPAADMKTSTAVISQSFLLSNMAPQQGVHFNRGIWEHLESSVRDWSSSRQELWIITGPAFLPKDGGKKMEFELIGSNRVAIPTHFFKIAIDKKPDGTYSAISFLLPHERIQDESRLAEFIVSIDEIEKATGLDFFELLDDAEEARLEAAQAPVMWSK